MSVSLRLEHCSYVGGQMYPGKVWEVGKEPIKRICPVDQNKTFQISTEGYL
mgnify:CR=1 FL=1